MTHHILGLDTFGDMTLDPEGKPLHAAQVLRNVVEEAVLADSLGVDAITLGEHHHDDWVCRVNGVWGPAVFISGWFSRAVRRR